MAHAGDLEQRLQGGHYFARRWPRHFGFGEQVVAEILNNFGRQVRELGGAKAAPIDVQIGVLPVLADSAALPAPCLDPLYPYFRRLTHRERLAWRDLDAASDIDCDLGFISLRIPLELEGLDIPMAVAVDAVRDKGRTLFALACRPGALACRHIPLL